MANSSLSTPGNELVAFFRDRSDALAAISDLKDAGFTSEQIGLATGVPERGTESALERDTMLNSPERNATLDASETSASRVHGDRSTWEKIKDFFAGEPETYAGDEENYQNTFGHLSVTGDRARYYGSGIAAGGALLTVKAPPNRLEEAREILEDNDGDLRTTGFEASATGVTGREAAGLNRYDETGHTGERRLQLRGELLRAVKERVNKGEIRLRKEVVTEHQTINVPVTREQVVVEQVPAGNATPVSGTIGDQGEIRIPVSEERVRVNKEQVVTGEVRVQKRAVQDTQQVSDEVRHEEVRVENEGQVNLTDKTKGKKKPAA
jgi:uncharacterized protein (TIGR02271 family)